MKINVFIVLLIIGVQLSFANADGISSDLPDLAIKYRNWILGSTNIDYSNPLIKLRYQEILKTVDIAAQKYGSDKNKDGIPEALLTQTISIPRDKRKISDLFSKYLFPLSLGYHLAPAKEHGLSNPYYHNEEVRQHILDIFNNLNRHGWTVGVDIGVLHMDKYPQTGYIGYYSGISLRCLGYAVSVFLNKDVLQKEGLLNRELGTLDFISKEVGFEFDTPILWQQNGFNTDAVRSMFNVRWCYILSMPENDPDKKKELAYFSRMLNKSLQIADGWADMIKPDYTGYHHKGAYLTAYAPFGYHVAAILALHLNGTPYQLSQQAINNLSQAVLHTRIYCHMYDAPRSVAGRFPDNLGTSIKNMPAFVYLSQLESPYQHELKAAFKRLWNPNFEVFKRDYMTNISCGISYTGSMGEIEQSVRLVQSDIDPEEHPNGFWFYPYGGLGIYRQKDWLVSFSGCSKYIWDYESSKSGENQFGRFSRAGVLRIMAGGEPISAEASGYTNEGWNWCRLPGATTAEMPFEHMKQKKYNGSHRLFTSESFLGGLHLDNNSAITSIKYEAPVEYDTPLKKLNANKSFFFFDDYIVALGTNIQAESNEDYPVQTTLFQTGMQNLTEATYLNGIKLTKGIIEEFHNESIYLTDAQGHAYFVPGATHVIVERKKQNAPNDDDKYKKNGHFISARLMHGNAPTNDSYRYFIKIRGGQEAAKDLSQNHQNYFSIIQQDESAHIVSYAKENVSAYALFKANTILKNDVLVTSNRPCLAMVKIHSETAIELAVQNPELGKIEHTTTYNEIHEQLTHAPSTIQAVEITLKGMWQLSAASKDASIVRKENNETTIRFSCFDGKRIKIGLVKN
jgi:hypothetical protein